jgi:DNA-binding PadR family transcriptional regulator
MPRNRVDIIKFTREKVMTSRSNCEGKKYTGLSAIILLVFAQNSQRNKLFSASGYDLSIILKQLRLNFSHQQIYREVKNIGLLKCEVMPQDGKPDRKVYSLIDTSAETLDNIQRHIDFNPKRTNPKIFLAFNLPNVAVTALDAYNEFMESEQSNDIKLQDRLEKNGVSTKAGQALREFELKLHDTILGALSTHVTNLLKTS